jgi:hypothetical protein
MESAPVQKHFLNQKMFTMIYPKFMQFSSGCTVSYSNIPDPSNYSSVALWFYVLLSLLGTAFYGFKLSQKNKKASYYTKTSIEIALNLYLSLYVLHGIMNCFGWHAFGRSLLLGILIGVGMAFIP